MKGIRLVSQKISEKETRYQILKDNQTLTCGEFIDFITNDDDKSLDEINKVLIEEDNFYF